MAQEPERRQLQLKPRLRRRRHAAAAAALFLALQGCGGLQRPLDGSSYPLQVRELREFAPDVTWATQVAGPDGEPLVLEAHLDPVEFERYLQLTTPTGTVLRRINLAAVSRLDGYSLADFDWDTAGPAQRPGADHERFLACRAHREASLQRLDTRSWTRDTLLRLERPPAAPDSVDWDPGLSGPLALAADGDESAPVLVSVNYNYWPAPRTILVYDSLGAREPRIRLESGGQLIYEGGADLDGDGRLEWLFASTAPCTGREAGDRVDWEAYYIALLQDGTVLWSTATGRGGGNSRLRWDADAGRLFGLRACRHFTGEDLYTLVHELDPATGDTLRETRWPGEVYFADGFRDLLHVDSGAEHVQWIGADDLQPRDRPTRIAGVRGLSGLPLTTPDGRTCLQLAAADGGRLLLDVDLSIVGNPGLALIRGERFDDPEGAGRAVFLATRPGEPLRLAALEAVPVWRWWPWRWRWGLALGLGLPLLGLSAWLVVRVVRLRRAAARQMRRFAQRLLREREEERRRVARELHDGLGQELVLARVAVLRESPDAAAAGEPGHEALAGLDAALDSMRRVVSELRPPVLDSLGLRAALEWQLERVAGRTGLAVAIEDDGPPLALPADLETALFRVFQEALTNVVKHAGASEVLVALRRVDGRCELLVEDDGRGVDAEAAGDCAFGWLGMRERLAPWGGRVEFERGARGGLRVRASIAKPGREER